MSEEFRFPGLTHRTLVVGRTGSGKTQFSAWLLSMSPFDKQPYVIVDYKHDTLLNSTDRFVEIGLEDKLPKRPGVYIVHPTPEVDDEAMESWLWKAWERENVALYFDEGYMIPNKAALRSILTQGRSKQVPVIMLSQRPSQLSRFAISEADFFAVFHQNDEDDKKRIAQFTPKGFAQREVPEFHSKWYDVAKNRTFVFKPVPEADEILSTFEERLRTKVRFI